MREIRFGLASALIHFALAALGIRVFLFPAAPRGPEHLPTGLMLELVQASDSQKPQTPERVPTHRAPGRSTARALDPSSAPIPGTSSAGLQEYASQIHRRIQARMGRFRLGSSMRPAQVLIRLTVLGNGTLEKAQVAHSSGIGLFDQEALQAIRSIQPLPPFDERLSRYAKASFLVPIEFRD